MKKNKALTPEQEQLAKACTVLQYKFVIQLLKPRVTKRKAYKKAGGKAKTPESQDAAASTMFKNIKVAAFYNSFMEKAVTSSIMERDEALEILSTNARVKMTDVADYRFIEVGKNKDGLPIMQTVWTMKDSADIDPALISCIKSVTMTKQGPKIELHDQQGAIKQIGDIQGWNAPKKTQLTGENGAPIVINSNVSAPEVVTALGKLMEKL